MTTRHPDTPDRPLTVEDLEHTPDDGRRYELTGGRLDVSPAPKPLPTVIESRLTIHLGNVAPDELSVLSGPGVTFSRLAHRIPDLAVFDQPPEEGYYTVPPLLAVEVVPPGSVLRDHHDKRREYAEFGIGSYWIIQPQPDKLGLMELRLVDGQYQETA